MFGYAVADAGGTRTITFTSLTGSGGSASAAAQANYETLLDGLKYNNTSDAPVNGSTRAFSVTVNDGALNSAAATFTVTLAATNDAPAVDLNTGTVGLNNTATFTEVSGPDTGANAVAFSTGGTNITDVEPANLANLKVSISTASAAAGDQLRFGATTINIAAAGATGEVTAGGTVFGYAVAELEVRAPSPSPA